MKNRTDKILLAVFLLSLTFYVFVLPRLFESIALDSPAWMYTLHPWLSMTFHAIPAFCLQLLLCRRTRRWIAALPALAVIGTALWSTYGFFTSTGWDTLGYGVIMLLCAAPAVGCALAWAAYGLHRLYMQRRPI